MSLYVQNYQPIKNYNASFKGKEAVVKTAIERTTPQVTAGLTAAGAAFCAAILARPLHEAKKQQLSYVPEDNFAGKSAVESAAPLIVADNSRTGIFGYPYAPEQHYSGKSAEESAYAFVHNDYRQSKFVRREDTRQGGRITKIVRYFEYPDYTVTTTFDYKDKKSVIITTDFSQFRTKDVKIYNDGMLTESYGKDKENGKYFNRAIYKYDSKGRVSKMLDYTNTGWLWTYEYEYDSKDRIIGKTTTFHAIPEAESEQYLYTTKSKDKTIVREQFIYDKNSKPIRVSRITETDNSRGKNTRIDKDPENYDADEQFYDPNKAVKLTKYQLSN